MQPLPRSVFAGRLLRVRLEGGLEGALQKLPNARHAVEAIDGTRWKSFWLPFARALSVGDQPQEDGLFRYPFLCRASDDRYILASTDSDHVEALLELTGIAGHVDAPRVHVDRATRELVFPPVDDQGNSPGRKYTLGAVYGAVEGYARALRNVSFFGHDIAEAALFRRALEEISVTRLTLRDPSTDRELISLNTTGGLDFHFKGAKHLNAIDNLTSFFRANRYIEWRVGREWHSL
jgi:hypothetical protein